MMKLRKSTKRIKSSSSRNIHLTPQEHEQALNGAYRSFRSPGLPKTDVDTYIEKITPYMKSLIEQADQKILDRQRYSYACGSNGRRQKKMVIELTPEEFEEAEDIPGEVRKIIVEKAFNSKMMEIFKVQT